MVKRVYSTIVSIFMIFFLAYVAWCQGDPKNKDDKPSRGEAVEIMNKEAAKSQAARKTKDDLYSQIELFSYALTTIQYEYVD